MNEDSKPTKQNYYNLKEGYTATNGLGYNFTVKELLTGGNVSISFREDKPPITIAAYNAFKGSVVNPYIAEEFVGEEYNTEKGGIFKVTKLLPREYYPDGTLKSAKYEGICSICSEDKELNPEPFNFDKSNMVLGKNITLPCQCSGRYDSVFRSEYKSKVVLSRFLGKSGLKLFSAWEGVVVKKSVVLYCPTHRKIICTELPRLISSKVSLCRSCRDDKLREDLISKHEKSVQNNFHHFSPPVSPKIWMSNPCWRPIATEEVQSRPTVPPAMRKLTMASSSNSRLAMVEAKSADSVST